MTAAMLERAESGLVDTIQEKSILTANKVKAACREIISEYRAWQQQDGPNVPGPNGSVTKGISDRLDSTIRRCIDSTADRGLEVEPEAKRFIMALDEVARSFRTWLQEASMGHPTAPPRGSDALHNALGHLEATLAKRNISHPEPINVLTAQNASPQMIAIKYGWRCEDGSPDTNKVFEEMRAPGTHYQPDTWVHPFERVEREAAEAKWAVRIPRPILFPETLMQAAPKPVVPSIEELLAAKAPAPQIAALHHLEIEEVYQLAADSGVTLDERHVIPVNAQAAHLERVAAEEETQRRVAAASANQSQQRPVAPGNKRK